MGGRPFRGSEAWEMFIAWPQRHWRANWERRRAKAAQAALQSQISCSKGQSREGEEKLLLANTQLKKLSLSQPKILQLWWCQPRDWGCQRQEQREVWLGTLVMAGACGSPEQEGLGVGQG